MRTGKIRPQGKVLDHWQLLHESDFEDTDTKLLLHFDNEITDWAQGATVTNSNVTFSSTVWKFGSYSSVWDGGFLTYLTVPDSADWVFGTGDFTIDCWIRWNSLALQESIVSQYQTDNNWWMLSRVSDQIYFRCRLGGAYIVDYNTTDAGIVIDTWYHVVFERTTTTAKVFINGVSKTLTATSAFGAQSMPDFAGVLAIGSFEPGVGDYPISGYLDELRIVKGTAKWTADFIPPIAPYLGRTTTYPITADRNNVLMISGEGANTSAAIIDETGKTVTATGAQISTAQSKFGQSSVRYSGVSDYISIPDSPDFFFGIQPFTIDLWARFNTLPNPDTAINAAVLYQQKLGVDGKNRVLLLTYGESTGTTAQLLFIVADAVGGVANYKTTTFPLGLNAWYHIALVRNGTDVYIFVNGISQPLTVLQAIDSSIMPDVAAPVQIGYDAVQELYPLDGWLDDFRVSKGIARWTSDFTPPLRTTALINGNTDEEYKMIMCLRSAVASNGFGCYVNSDTTAANYGCQYLLGESTTVYAARATTYAYGLRISHTGDAAGDIEEIEAFLYAKSGYIRTMLSTCNGPIAGTTVTGIQSQGSVWNNTTQLVDSLVITSIQATGIDCGSKILLYRKVQ